MKHKKLVKKILVILFAATCMSAMLFGYEKRNSGENTEKNDLEHTYTETDASEKRDEAEMKDNIEETSDVISKEDIEKKTEASYEKWLASAMIIAISMRYADFEIENIYYLSETTASEKMDSQGVCVVFSEEGEQKCIVSKPVAEEIKEQEKITLYSQDIGYASFEEKDVNALDAAQYKNMKLEELEEIISQSLLVSIYEH